MGMELDHLLFRCRIHFKWRVFLSPGASGTEHPAIRNVTQAYIQGLSQNLAFFLAKSGQQVPVKGDGGMAKWLRDYVLQFSDISWRWFACLTQAIFQPHAPMVFQQGAGQSAKSVSGLWLKVIFDVSIPKKRSSKACLRSVKRGLTCLFIGWFPPQNEVYGAEVTTSSKGWNTLDYGEKLEEIYSQSQKMSSAKLRRSPDAYSAGCGTVAALGTLIWGSRW